MENQEFKVKAVEGSEQKSVAEIEEKLLKQHEESFENDGADDAGVEASSESTTATNTEESVQPQEETQESAELKDEDIISYIKDRYNKDITSVDDLFAQKEINDDLPEDVKTFFEYKKETGRGIDDFVRLQKDYENMDASQLLTEYYAATEEGLDTIDIQDLIEDKFGYDEDLDEDKDIKKKKLAQKRELVKAKKFFNEQKDKYKIPLESSGSSLSDEQAEEFNRYKSYIEEAETSQQKTKERYDYFLQKTNEVFNDDFKGFDFKVGENEFTYKPGDASELKNVQSDVNNFVKKFMDKDSGLIKDAEGYHRAIAMAMNPEKFAQFFYDQGVAATVDNVSKKSKNINMEMRNTPQSTSKGGLKIKSLGQTSSRGLKIKSIKKS